MRRRVLVLLLAATALISACQKKSEDGPPAEASAKLALASAAAPAADSAQTSNAPTDAAAPTPSPAASAGSVAGPMLAYSHSLRIEAPAGSVVALYQRHQAACTAAGPLVCQVVGASTSKVDKRSVSARLEIRAEPRWLGPFRARVEGDADAAGGEVKDSQTQSEDLSRSIIDTEATLRAKRLLRARLEAMLAGHPGKLSELLEVEKALAEVQAEIDTAESELAVMRNRVRMSTLTLTYNSTQSVASLLITLTWVLAILAVIFGPPVWLYLRARARPKG